MVGTVILTTWQIYGKMSTMYPFFKVTVSTLDVLGTLLMAIFDIIDTLNRTLLNQSHIRTFYKNLSKIDKFLGLPPTRNYFMSGVYSYKLTVIAMHVVIFATFSYDVYSTSFFYSWHHYKYNVFTFVLKYKITWFVVHLYMAACTIRRRFDLLNRTFVAAVRTTNGGTLAVKCMKCHDLLCDLVASINKVYGFQIMIMDKIVALSVVESSYLCLLFVIEARTKFSVVALATNLIWSADFMVSTEEIVLFFDVVLDLCRFGVLLVRRRQKTGPVDRTNLSKSARGKSRQRRDFDAVLETSGDDEARVQVFGIISDRLWLLFQNFDEHFQLYCHCVAV
jgi:hypothetical protein